MSDLTSNNSEVVSKVGAIADGIKGAAKSDKLKTSSQVAGALKVIGSTVGYAANSVSLANAITSDNPEHNVPRELTKIFGAGVVANLAADGTLGALAGLGVTNPLLAGTLAVAAAALFAYYGSEAVGLLFDEVFEGKFQKPKPLGKLFYISDEEVYEYEGKVVFYVTNLTDKVMELDLSTINGSANEKDYEPISIPKVLEAHQTIPVEITIKNNDDDDKRIENFYLSGRITNPQDFENEVGDSNFVYTDKGTCTIFDKNYVDIKISRPIVMESELKATFTITLSKELDEPLKLKATTMDGSAKDKLDYTALIGKEFEIPAGVTSWDFDIDIVNDEELEENPIVEDFMFILEPNDAEQARKYDLDPQYFSYAKIIDDDPATEYAILCDTTGSMSNIISSVKAQAIDIVNSIFAKDPNARIGVFGYNDPDVQTFTHLTNDKSAVISAINSLYAIGGWDIPEMLYHGIYNAANSNWSKNTQKKISVSPRSTKKTKIRIRRKGKTKRTSQKTARSKFRIYQKIKKC